jgi:hypothetical protein
MQLDDHMDQQSTRLRTGDFVEVKAPEEILQTLDAEGALDHLPFMPEMLEFCGRRFRISRRALVTCASGMNTPRGFKTNDVVTLDSVRCSGAAHDGCQKACTIFWREAWLRKVENSASQSKVTLGGSEQLQARLKVSTGQKTYFCQASELAKFTFVLSKWQRVGKYLSGLRANNFSGRQMVQSIGIWLFLKIRRIFLGVYPRGSNKSTPAEILKLQPGEWVEVKSIKSIAETLNESGSNRGLWFFGGMDLFCGRRYRVKGRLDRIIVDGTGEMRKLNNTVLLEGVTCRCAYLGFGMDGCSRCEFAYWREIWLRRSDQYSDPPSFQGSTG